MQQHTSPVLGGMCAPPSLLHDDVFTHTRDNGDPYDDPTIADAIAKFTGTMMR
jgi:hypothetical protein